MLEKSAGTRYEHFKVEIFSQMEQIVALFLEKYGKIGKNIWH